MSTLCLTRLGVMIDNDGYFTVADSDHVSSLVVMYLCRVSLYSENNVTESHLCHSL